MKNKKIDILKSTIQGKGVFAIKNIKKGQKVFTFANKKIIIKHSWGCHCDVCKRCIQIGKNLWLSPDKDSFGWNLNHSCNPSCFTTDKDICAFRNIKKGEEITIDYSTTNIDKKWKMKCSCKSKKCRKIIRSVQFLSKKLFNKYKGHMPKYVEENY